MTFNELDLTIWPRAQVFYYFSEMAPTSYSITVDVDVTSLINSDMKFFPTYLWLVTRCINRQVEFKLAYVDGKLGYYDTLTPLYAAFHDDDKTFSLMWTEYDDDYDTFIESYLVNQKVHGNTHGILSQPETPPPPNAYTVSAVPWISFSHFAVHSHENRKYFFPSIEAGKVYEDDKGRKLMPLSLTCHHAATDGYHIRKFLDDLEEEMSILCSQ